MSGELKAIFGALPRTTRGQPLIITGKADKKNMVYCHGNSVFIRNLEDPAQCDVYTEHTQQTTVAKYSPSGYYIASADTTGKLRIWDTVNAEHILKNEFQPFAGPVRDLDWTGDSQRIAIGGAGREKFCHAISADTGTSVGDMIGHTKSVNAIAFRTARPFRIATASEDQTICFYHGPPFKLNSQMSDDHKNFVNALDYAPDGSKFVSGGADGRACVFEGKTGEKLIELGSPAHKGGIYGVRFSPDNKEILSVSGDKTAKIWNAETGEVVCDFTLGTAVPDMQLGCAWIGDHIITVSLSGVINYLDRNNPASPSRVIRGHNKMVTSVVASGDKLYTGDSDGKICMWDANTGTATDISGTGHTAQIQGMSLNGGTLHTCSIDDTAKTIDTSSQSYNDNSVAMSSQPKGIASGGDYTVVACVNEVLVLENGRLLFTQKADYEPTCVTINANQTEIAVGGGRDNKVHVYSLENGTIKETQILQQTGSISCVSYSPDGAYLAAGDSNRKVALYQCPEYKVLVDDTWTAHTAKVLCLAWSPDSQHIASGALDTHIKIWTVGENSKHITIERAHKMSAVSAVSWRSNNELVSVGHDSCVKLWNVSY